MDYAVQMTIGFMMYIPSFMKTCTGVQVSLKQLKSL
jgi:hypothetical protein